MQGQRPSLRQKKYVDGIHEDIRNASAMKQEPTSPAAPPLPQASDSPAAGSPLPQDWEAMDEENDKQVTCLSGPRPGCGTWSQTHQPMGGQHFTLACHGKALVLANPPFHSIALRATLNSAQASIPEPPISTRPLCQGDTGPPAIYSKGELPAIQMQGLSDLRAPPQVSQPPAARMVPAEEQGAAVPADNTPLPPSSTAVSSLHPNLCLQLTHNSSNGANHCGITIKPLLTIDAGSKGASSAAAAACWRHNGCR